MGRVRAECFICGLDFYQDEMVRHYKLGRLVDVGCDDEISHTDYYEIYLRNRGEERIQRSEQPVPFQGEVARTPGEWYVGRWYVSKWRG